FKASVSLQPVWSGKVARANLRRPFDLSSAVEKARHIFGNLRARSVSNAVRTAFVSDSFFTVELRVERYRAAARAGRDRRRRVAVVADGPPRRHLGHVYQRRAQGPDRQEIHWYQSPRVGCRADLPRPFAAGLGTSQVAPQRNEDARPYRFG